MAERVLRARFEGDISGLKRFAQEGRQEIGSVADAQEKAAVDMSAASAKAETQMVTSAQSGAKRRIDVIRRETDEAIKAIEKLPIAREEKERQIARIIETNAKRTSSILRQEIRQQEQTHRQVADVMGVHSEAATSLAKSIAGLVAAYVSLQGIIGMAGKGLTGNADLQQAELTFEVLFQDAERAKAKIQELYQFSARTPFEFAPVKDAALALETFGLNSSQYLRDAGDLAAAFNAEISEVARVFGRINSGDFGEAFERLRDFGISRQMLEGEGLVFDKSGSYQGSVDQALTAIQTIIQRKFGGMMERQAQIFNGQMSTLADNFQSVLNTAMAASFDALSEGAKGLNSIFEDADVDGTIGQSLNTVAATFGSVLASGLKTGAELAGDIGFVLLKGAEGWANIINQYRWLFAQNERPAFRDSMLKRLDSAFPQLSGAAGPGITGAQANGPLVAFRALVQRGMSAEDLQKFINSKSGDALQSQTDIETRKRLFQLIMQARQDATGTMVNNLESIVSDAQGKIRETLDAAKGRATGKPTGSSTKSNEEIQKIQDSWVEDMVDRSADALEQRLSALLRGKSQGMTSATSRLAAGIIRGTNYGLGIDIRSGIPSTLADKPLPSLTGLIDSSGLSDAELFKKMEAQWYGANQKESSEELLAVRKQLADDAEKGLRSGLDAGVAAFLDGGIQGLGTSIYSVSKQALGKALVDAMMGNSGLKDFLGKIGAELFPVAAFAGIGFAGASSLAEAVSRPGIDAFKDRQEEVRRADARAMQEAAEKQLEAAEKQRRAAELAARNLERIDAGKDRILDLQTQVDVATGKITQEQANIITAGRDGQELIDAAISDALANGIKGTDATRWAGNFQRHGVSDKYVQQIMDVNQDDKGDQYIQLIANAVREANLLMQLAQAQNGTQSIGNLSNPDTALQFDAPQTRNIVNNNQFIVQAQAFMGDRADAREFAMMIASEIRTIEGQAV